MHTTNKEALKVIQEINDRNYKIQMKKEYTPEKEFFDFMQGLNIPVFYFPQEIKVKKGLNIEKSHIVAVHKKNYM